MSRDEKVCQTTPEELPPRAVMLETVVNLVCNSRNRQHGDPEANLALAGTLKEFVRAANLESPAAHTLSAAEWECIDQILSKVARLVLGKEPNLDNPIDIAGYASLLYEVMYNKHVCETN